MTDPTDEDGRVSTWLAELARAPAPGEEELSALAAGDAIGGDRYRIRRELGRGGMGIVYEADDTKLTRRVAIKTHQAASMDARGRLLVEAQAMAKLSHPHIVAVHDVGEFEGGVFLVAELIRGGDLETWRTPDRSWSEVVDAYLEAGRGLAYAHAAGLVHRDFKPTNVLVGVDGRCQVSDFGIAVAVAAPTQEDDGSGQGTKSGDPSSHVAGTPAYMAPEQILGGPADARSDQFSFCVALCEALLGQRPYRKTARDLSTAPPVLRSGSTRVPRRILRLLERGIAVQPSKRFPSMNALLAALEHARAPRRAAWLVVGGLVVGGFGLAGMGAIVTMDREAPCSEGIEAPLQGWSDEGRQRLGQVFAEDEQAAKLWPAMQRAVDGFATQWVETATVVCQRRETTTDALTHQAQRCLDEVRRDADATLASLQRASGRASRNGPARAEAWISPTECLHARFVLATPSVPVLLRPRVEALRQTLRDISNDAESGAVAEDLQQRLDAVRPEVESMKTAYPQLQARFAFTEAAVVGRTDPRKTEPVLKRAYHYARAANHPGYAVAAATALTELFAVYLGDTEAAVEWAEVALVEAARDGVSSERVVETERIVAIAYDRAGQWERAAAAYDKALASVERLTGEDRERTRAAILISVSGFEGARGNLDRAISTGMEAVDTFERLDGGPSRASLSALGNVGLALDSAGRLEEAQALFERELRERTKLLGPEHPEHIAALINLGLVAVHQGRSEEARTRWTAAGAVVERYYGKRHPDRADIETNIAWLDEAAGKYAEAERRYVWASRVLEETLGSQSERTLLASQGLANARLKLGKLDTACQPLAALADTARDALGETRVLAGLLETRGDCATARKDPEGAESMYREALRVLDLVSEPAESQVEVQLKLASALWERGSESEARTLVEALSEAESVATWINAHEPS